MRMAHSSSGIALLILLNLLSCAKLTHCKTAGKRPLVAHVADRCVEAWEIAQYGPEMARKLQVEKRLTIRIHLLLSAKSFQYLLNRCIAIPF